jgi:hypothetical protein
LIVLELACIGFCVVTCGLHIAAWVILCGLAILDDEEQTMGDQLTLFKLTREELEKKASLAAMLDLEIIQLQADLKDAQVKLRDCEEYAEVADIKGQIKMSKERLLKVHSELRAASRENLMPYPESDPRSRLVEDRQE